MSQLIRSGQGLEVPVPAGQSLRIASITGTYSAAIVAGAGIGALATNSSLGAVYGPYAGGVVIRISCSADGISDWAVGTPAVLDYMPTARLVIDPATGDATSVIGPSGSSAGGSDVLVTGTPGVGNVLTASFPAGVGTVKWQRYNGSTWDDIASATNLTYTQVTADVGKQVRAIATSYAPYGASVTVPTPAPPAGIPFARRLGAPSSGFANSSNYVQFNANCRIENRLSVPVNKLRLKYVNAVPHASNGTMIPGPRRTIQVGISNLIGTRTLATFGGLTTLTQEPGQEDWTDEFTLGADIPPTTNNFAMAMVYAVYETAPAMYPNTNINATNNSYELSEGAVSGLASKAAGTSVPASRLSGKVMFGPSAMLATPVGAPATTKAFFITGDSITSGSSANSSGNIIGFAQQAVQATGLPWAAASQEGYSYNTMMGGGGNANAEAFTLTAATGATHAFCFLGVNDIRSGQNSAQIRANMAKLKADLLAIGVPKLYVSTCWPTASNAAGNGDPGGGIWTRLNELNADIRAGLHGCDGFFDLNAVARDPVNNNFWRSDGGTPTVEGVHPYDWIHVLVQAEFANFLAALP